MYMHGAHRRLNINDWPSSINSHEYLIWNSYTQGFVRQIQDQTHSWVVCTWAFSPSFLKSWFVIKPADPNMRCNPFSSSARTLSHAIPSTICWCMLGDDSGASSGAPPSNAPQSGFFGTLSNVATGYKPLCRCAILLVCLRLMSLYTGLHSFEVSAATTTSTATQPLLIADDIDTSTHMRVATSDVLLGESAAVALVTVNVCDLRLVISRCVPLAVFLALHSSRAAYLSPSLSRHCVYLVVLLALRSSHCVYFRLAVLISHCVYLSLCSSRCVPLAVFLALHSSCCVYLSLCLSLAECVGRLFVTLRIRVPQATMPMPLVCLLGSSATNEFHPRTTTKKRQK